MKSKAMFEIIFLTNEVLFLDEAVFLKHEKLRATLFTKPTVSRFCLNTD